MAYLRSLRLTSRISSNFNRLRSFSTISFSEEVNQARLEHKPLVALESTIITHGMPFPQNLETAVQVENIIRQRGAVPATVAVLKGQLTVGLSEAQLRYLAQAPGVVKTSRRDFAPVAAAQLDGATTVAGTIVAADLADIPVFVTGGIGGVHREGESTLDISADLNELGRSRTLVVCSGVKSILDIGRTLEYLETQGVCVCAFGETDHFPAFYTRRSGHHAPYHVTDAYHAARVLHSAHRLQLTSAIVVAVPVPEEHAMNETIIEAAIEQALIEAKENGIKGKEVTPFILTAVADATKGASLAANIALIKNNAKVGADIAVEFNKLQNVNNLNISKNIEFSSSARKCKPNFPREFHTSSAFKDSKNDDGTSDMPIFFNNTHSNGDVLVIGGANVDRTYRVTEDNIQLDGSTHGCAVGQCGGGVGRNMAEALWRLREGGGAGAGGGVRLLTALGDDGDGRYLQHIQPGLLLDGCVVRDGRTASYAAVLDARGECRLGLGDMELHDHITIELIEKNIEVLNKAPLVVMDGNPPQATIEHVLRRCHELRKPVFFEPTDRRKAIKALQSEHHPDYASPNVAELRQMANFLQQHQVNSNPDFKEIIEMCKIVSHLINYLIVTLGEKGVLVFHREKCKHTVRLYPVEILEHVQNVSGAGDCFASGFIHGMLLGLKESNCVSLGFQAAKCALFSNNSVPTYFNNYAY